MEGRGRVYVCEVARCVLSELYNCIMIVCSSRGASAHLPGITKQHPANLFGQHSTCNFKLKEHFEGTMIRLSYLCLNNDVFN